MRSLSTKLTLAFLLVGLTGAVLVAVIIRQQTRNAFDRFILNREQQALAASLVATTRPMATGMAWATSYSRCKRHRMSAGQNHTVIGWRFVLVDRTSG